MHKMLLYVGFGWGLLGACTKDDIDPNGLPKATQSGKNTAGFLLNGQPWLPAINRSLPANPVVGATRSSRIYQGGRSLQISFARYQSQSSTEFTALNLIFHDLKQPGTFDLNQDIDPFVISGPRPPYAVYTADPEPGPKREYYTSSITRGQVIITRFDTVARVVSGTFAAKVQEESGTEVLDITQGRFDCSF